MEQQLATISFEQIENIVRIVTWQGVAALGIITLWKSGMFGALASRLGRKSANTEAITEEVYALVKGNHMGDIQKAFDNLGEDIKSLREEIGNIRDRVARVEGMMERNGFNH